MLARDRFEERANNRQNVRGQDAVCRFHTFHASLYSSRGAMTEKRPPSVARIADAILVNTDGEEHRAAELWKSQPVLLLLVHRPGCVLCRAQARRIWTAREGFQELNIKMICLVHEWLKPEIVAFKRDNWGGDLLLDKNKALYKALGDGKLNKQSYFTILRNFPALRKKVKAEQQEFEGIGNIMHLAGDKTVLGGLMVIKPGNKGVQYMFAEAKPGDRPPLVTVLEKCQTASGKHLAAGHSMSMTRSDSYRECDSEECTPRSASFGLRPKTGSFTNSQPINLSASGSLSAR